VAWVNSGGIHCALLIPTPHYNPSPTIMTDMRVVYESNSDSDDAHRCASRKIDPFAPDAAVPLPFQIGEEYGWDEARHEADQSYAGTLVRTRCGNGTSVNATVCAVSTTATKR
jgi:hypothetical protein